MSLAAPKQINLKTIPLKTNEPMRQHALKTAPPPVGPGNKLLFVQLQLKLQFGIRRLIRISGVVVVVEGGREKSFALLSPSPVPPAGPGVFLL